MRYMTRLEMVQGTDDLSAVHPLGWVVRREEFETDKSLAKAELSRSLGQVLYLNNLAKVGTLCVSVQWVILTV